MPSPQLPPEDQVRRFRVDLQRLAGAAPIIGMAVSGGPDSLALLLLAAAAFPSKIEAATVDHGLRPESAAEADFVAALCASLSVAHAILKVDVPKGGEGLQGEARRARYRALSRWAADRQLGTVCTAHHADDQAETILMRLQRGSGVGGLASVRALRREGPGLLITRPLLGWTRAELGEVVRACGVSAIDDPSNHDSRFDRVVMRQFLRANPQFELPRLARSAASLAEADEALEWMADMMEAQRSVSSDGEWRIEVEGAPREVRRRLLRRAIAAVRADHGIEPRWNGGEDVEGLMQALEAGGTATLAGTMATAIGTVWHVRIAPPRR